MKVAAFGPIEVDGHRPAPRERVVLAVLALRRGRFVAVEELADAVWREALPPTWRKQLQIAVGRVRRLVGADRVETAGARYLLRLADDELDAARFEALVAQSRSYAGLGEHTRAVAVLDDAFGLWRGEPWADLADWPPGADEATRLAEVRRTAEEEHVRARLDGGWHRSVVAEAGSLVQAEPVREDRWVMFATALYRSGRQREALQVLREARARLRGELGLDPGQGLSDLETAILTQDPRLDPRAEPPAARDDCPYRGLAAFDVTDAEDFFGREQDVADTLDALLARRLVVLTGPSGSGKSSLARAGVAPTLQRLGTPVRILTPGGGGLVALRAARAGTPRAVLVVDQLEELFQPSVPDDEREEYARILVTSVDEGGLVLVTVRSDHLDRCAGLAALGPLLSDAIRFLAPMTETGLRAAVEEPARLSGLQVEPGLTELVVRDVLGEPAALPHMSHALVETWARREGPVLTVAGYRTAGGISGAIAQSAEARYGRFDAESRDACRSVLVRLVSLDAAGAPVRRRTPVATLREDPVHAEVLAELVEARLVTLEHSWALVAHESLATAWPRLRGWLEEDAEGTRLLAALSTAADDWVAGGESEADLYRSARLHAALDWSEGKRVGLTPTERRFLEASAAREQEELTRLAEQARVEASRNRRLRGLLAAVLALLLVAGVTGVAAVSAQRRSASDSRRATAARDDAEFATLVATSVALRSSQREVAALLAAEAYRRRPDDPRARNAMMSTLVAAGGFLGTDYVDDAEWLSGGATADGTLVLVRSDGHAGVYLADPLREVRPLALEPPGDVEPGSDAIVALSRDGATAVIGLHLGGDRTWFSAYDVGSGSAAGAPVELPFGATRVALATDGRRLAVVGWDGALSFVDLGTGDVRPASGRDVVDAAYAGRDLVALHSDGTVTRGRAVLGPVPESAVGNQLAVSGDRLVTSGPLSVAALDLGSGALAWSRPYEFRREGACIDLAVHARSDAVYCGDGFGRIQRRDLATDEVTDELDRQLGRVGRLSVSDHGRVLTAVGGGVAAVSRWRLDGGGPVSRLIAAGRVLWDGYDQESGNVLTAVRPDRVASADDYHEYRIWDPTSDHAVSAPIEGSYFGWVGPGVLQGIFGDTNRVEYLDAADGRRYLGPDPLPLPPDTDQAHPSAAGTHVYISHSDGRIQNIDPATGAAAGPDLLVDGYPLSFAPDPDDAHLAVVRCLPAGCRLSILDTETTEVVADAPTDVEVVSYSPDGHLYGAGATGRINRFSTATLAPDRTLPGARGWINSLQFSSDGSLLLATGNDSTVTLYDVASSQRIGDPINSEAPGIIPGFLKPDGTEMLVSVPAGVAAWDLVPAHQLAAVCRIAGRQLTSAEWETYLSAIGGYRRTCPT